VAPESILYFGPFNPFHYSPLPFYPHASFFNSFKYTSLYLLPSYLMFYDITDGLSFSFPFSFSPSSIEKIHIYKHVQHMSLCMIMLVLCVCLYLLDLSSTYERKRGFCLFFIIHMCRQRLGHSSPLPHAPSLNHPNPSLTPPTGSLPDRNYFALMSNFFSFIYLFIFIIFFYYSYVHTMLASFHSPAPTPSLTTHTAPSLSPQPPRYPAETILPLSLILL
jgi:hypothetical protein